LVFQTICITVLYLATAANLASSSPEKQIEIMVVNGRNGKPMANETLLVFLGNSDEEVRKKRHHIRLQTDVHGIAILPRNESTYSRVQVWVDHRTLCQNNPNNRTFDLDKIRRTGVSTPNNCENIQREQSPNQFVVFARRATLREKMGW